MGFNLCNHSKLKLENSPYATVVLESPYGGDVMTISAENLRGSLTSASLSVTDTCSGSVSL